MRKSLGTRQLVQAERALARLIAKSRPGQVDIELTVWKAVDKWLEEKHKELHGLVESTLRNYRIFGNKVQAFWKRDELLEDVNTEQVYEWLDTLSRGGLTPQGVKKNLALLRQLFNWHQDLGNMNRNPARPIKLRGALPQRTEAMLEPEYLELIADAEAWAEQATKRDDAFYRTSLVDLLQVLFFSGLRSIEAFRLQWEDIDFKQRVWTIRSPQNKGGVKILPMHPRVVEVLEGRWRDTGAGPFDAAEPVRNRWKRFKNAHARWKGTSMHALRHGFVTRLVLQGKKWQAQQLAGHHSEKMTDHYTHIQAEDLREALDGI